MWFWEDNRHTQQRTSLYMDIYNEIHMRTKFATLKGAHTSVLLSISQSPKFEIKKTLRGDISGSLRQIPYHRTVQRYTMAKHKLVLLAVYYSAVLSWILKISFSEYSDFITMMLYLKCECYKTPCGSCNCVQQVTNFNMTFFNEANYFSRPHSRPRVRLGSLFYETWVK